ncbi:MAG: MFS transporter [Dehalococcoidales bacterium]|nr:MFS transporter [Dehalococcoidales bacterium]
MSQGKKSGPRVFFGWWSVAFIGIISGLGHGFNTYGISVFFKPIAEDLGLNRAFTSLAAGIGRLEGGITSPLVGWLSDKFGPKWIIIFGICVAGVGMVFMNYVTEVWHYYVAWGVLIGLGLNIGLTVACDKSINDWFMRRRGLAQGIKFAIISIFGIIVLQIITPLIDLEGWRFTCLVWGIIMFASVPFAYMLIKPQRPEYYNMLPDGAEVSPDTEEQSGMAAKTAGYASESEEVEYTFRQAIKTGTYWLLIISFSAHNFIAGGFNVHIFPFLTDIGITEAVASSMMGMMIVFTVPARFFGGLVADRVPKSRVQLLLVGAFLLQVIGLGVYLVFQNLPGVYVLLACHGLSSGAVTPLVIVMIGRYFGRKSFGSILGTVIAFLSPVGLIAPVFYGWVFDNDGSYNLAFITALIFAALATLLMFFVRSPRPPAGETISQTW